MQWLNEIAEADKFVHIEEMNVLLYWESTLNTESLKTIYSFSRAKIRDPSDFKSKYIEHLKKVEFEVSGFKSIFVYQDHLRPNVIIFMSGWSTVNAYETWIKKIYSEPSKLMEKREKLGILYPPDIIDSVKQISL